MNTKSETHHARPSRIRKPVKITLIIIAVLVVLRLILPYVVLHYANKSLANMKGYYGHIEDIDIALIRGAYVIDSIYLNEVDEVTSKQTPFVSASAIDLSVEWKALFKGSIVGELVFEKPTVHFTKDRTEPKDVKKDSASFEKLLDDFMPLRINRVEINNGVIGYRDLHSKPRVDIQMTDIFLLASNLRNSYDSAILLPSTIRATANIYDGSMEFNARLNPLAEQPTFDMNAEVKGTNLVKLNEFFEAYAKVDVNKGTFGMYAEVAAKEGGFSGYVKPLIKDLDVLGKEDRDDNLLHKLWEGVVGTAAELFQNQRKDQLATKIPFEGKVSDPNANIWITIMNTLRNAFISAIQPSIDNEITIASVDSPKEEKKTFLQKIFGKKDDKNKDDDKDNEKNKDEDKEKSKDKNR